MPLRSFQWRLNSGDVSRCAQRSLELLEEAGSSIGHVPESSLSAESSWPPRRIHEEMQRAEAELRCQEARPVIDQ